MAFRRIGKRWRAWRYRFGARFLGPCGDAALPPATAILMSYRRPANMEAIVGQLLRLRFVERVVLSNNNPDVDISEFVKRRDARLTIIEQPRRRPASIRAALARDHPAERYISLDDDIFLTAAQIETVYRGLLAEPDVVHGVQGGARTHDGERPFRGDIRGDATVELVHRAYFFARPLVDEWFRLLDALGYATADALPNAEDVIFSFAGRGRPRCHDVGGWIDCETSDAAGIALWREPDFDAPRAHVFDQLAARRVGGA